MIFAQSRRPRGSYGQNGRLVRCCPRHLELPCYGSGAELRLARLNTRTGSQRGYNPLAPERRSPENISNAMSRPAAKRERALALKYPPSEPCACETCRRYCLRPGWWTVEEAATAIRAGYGSRMMLEVAPERSFGVLSPAFRGCERSFALNRFADRGCNFLRGDLCELHGTGIQPLECRFCHHDRPGMGPQCHADLENDWHSPSGRALVARWAKLFGLRADLKVYGLSRIVGA